MSPAQAVGGDFYGVYPLDENRMALIVGDVADKGMPAAIFMAQTHALLRASIEKSQSPAKVLHYVNDLMLEMNAQGLFATVIYGILNGANGEFHYVRGGHELPLILDANRNVSIPERGKGQALGVIENPSFEEQTLVIPPGGMILLYSDGVTDDLNASGEIFDMKRLIEVIENIDGDVSAKDTCAAIYNALIKYQGGEPQFDDVTLLAAKRL